MYVTVSSYLGNYGRVTDFRNFPTVEVWIDGRSYFWWGPTMIREDRPCCPTVGFLWRSLVPVP
jgi:hypothetical protein